MVIFFTATPYLDLFLPLRGSKLSEGAVTFLEGGAKQGALTFFKGGGKVQFGTLYSHIGAKNHE